MERWERNVMQIVGEPEGGSASPEEPQDSAWKYISVGDIKGWNDYTDREYNYRDIPFLGQVVGHAADSATSFLGDVAKYAGADALGDYLTEKAQEGEDYLPQMTNPELSLAYLTDPNGLASAFGMLGGSMLAMAPATMLMPASGAAYAGRLAAKLPGFLGRAGASVAPGAARWAMTGPLEAASEAGDTMYQAEKQGASPEEARAMANKDFLGNAALLSVTNGLEGGLLGKSSRLFKKIPKANSRTLNALRGVANFAPATAAEMALQGYEEGAQQGIQNMALDNGATTYNQVLNPLAWNDDQWNQAKFAVAGSLPLVGGAAGMNALSRRLNRRSSNDPVLDNSSMQVQEDPALNPQADTNAANQIPDITVNEPEPLNVPDIPEANANANAPKGGNTGSGLTDGFNEWAGKRMDNGKNGCVEAVGKMGSHYSSFLAEENAKGVVYVPTLVADAGDRVIAYDPSKVERGDVIVYGDNDHVVIADGNGGYYGNSSSQEKVIHGDDLNSMGGLAPTKIIKTGGDTAGGSDNGAAGADVSGKPGGNIATAISQRTGLPADWIWAQMAAESGGDMNSTAARENHNYAGIDSGNRHFDSDEDFVDYMVKQYEAYRGDGIFEAKTMDEFAERLRNGGYFTDDLSHYQSLMHDALGNGGSKGGNSNTTNVSNFAADVLNDAKSNKPYVVDFFGDWVKDIKATTTNPDILNDLDSMSNSRGIFRNTPDNREKLAQKYAQELKDYANTLYATRTNPAPERYVSVSQRPKTATVANSAQTGEPQKIEISTKKLQEAKANNTLSIDNSAQTAQNTVQAIPSMKQVQTPAQNTGTRQKANQQGNMSLDGATRALTRFAVDKVNELESTVGKSTTKSTRLRKAIQQGDVAAIMIMYPKESASVLAPYMNANARQTHKGTQINAPQERNANATPLMLQQGRNLINLAQQNNVALPKPMIYALNRGSQTAINKAADTLTNEGIAVPQTSEVVNGELTNNVVDNQKQSNSTQGASAQRAEGEDNQVLHAESAPVNEPEHMAQGEVSRNFNSGTYRHTKKNVDMPSTKLMARVASDKYKRLKALAKENGGYYSPFAKQFLFKDEAGRDTFVRAADRDVFGEQSKQMTAQNNAHEQDKQKSESEPEVSNNFEADVYTNAKTGEKRPAAKLKAHIKARITVEQSKALKSIAKKYDGHYSIFTYGGRFVFNDEAGRDAFIVEADRDVFGEQQPATQSNTSEKVKQDEHSIDKSGEGFIYYTQNHMDIHIDPAALDTVVARYPQIKPVIDLLKEQARTDERAGRQLGQLLALSDDDQATATAGYIYNQARANYLADKKLGRTIDDAMPDKLAKASVILGNLERGSISPRDAYSKLTEIFDEQDLVPRKIESESEQPTSETAGNDDDSTQKNINDGMDALDHVLATHIDENKAMNRPEIGPIDFVWGKEGTAAKDYEDGYGIAKILKKHGKTAVDAIPEVIAKGTFSQRYKDRVYFEHNGYRAVVRLTWDGKAKTWLVTNFEQTKEANPGAEEDRRSASKHAGTSSSKGLASSTHIIPHEQKEGTKNLAYTDGRFSDNSKDDNAMRGTVKNGVMTIWRKRGKKKDASIITISVDEVNEALKKGSANSEYTLHQLAKQKDYAAMEAWIEGTKKPELRQKRRDLWEENKLYPAEDRAIDSMVHVIKNLYETATGEPPRSPWEKHQEAKKNAPETRADGKEEPVQEEEGSTKAAVLDIVKRTADNESVRNAAANSDEQELRSEIAKQMKEVVTQRMVDALSDGGDSLESMKVINARYHDDPAFRKQLEDSVFDTVKGANKKDDSIFGSVEDADREMLDALGLSEEDLQEDVLEAPPGISNTAEERERLEKQLSAELNKMSAMPMFNPKIYTLGLKLAMTYVKDGYNTFKKLVTKLHAAFGDKIGPWAPALAETVRTWPKGVPFDEKKVMAISKAVGARYEGGITSLDEMQADMKKLLKGQHKAFVPMIEASYNGIRKFFDGQEGEKKHGDESRQETGESPDAGREGRQSAAAEGTGTGRTESGGVSGAESGNRKVARGRDSGSAEKGHSAGAEPAGVRAGTELETAAGAGDRERGPEKPVLTEAQAHPSPEETPGHDYEIKPDKKKKTPAVRFKQNIDAIKLLKQLEADDRMPTPKEQDVLGNYNGWGGLKDAFLNTKMNQELRAVLTPEEYKAAQSTVNDAFYTPAAIVRAVWKGVSRLGFTGGRVLDPSMGVGNFFGCMPRDMMKHSSLRGIEIDSLTSRIARMLYPSALVEHTGFEKAQLADNFYDLVISNIPFNANLRIAGYRIHNYFFAHGMDKVRPGGLMVYITSQGSLTNGEDGARMRAYLGKKADMVAAYKLPSGAFDDAGTSVGTDIVIFRKRGENEMKPSYAQDFQHLTKMFTQTNWRGDTYGGVTVNQYFKDHPENIIGKAFSGRDQYGNDVMQVTPKEGADIAKELSKAMNKLPKDIYAPVNRTGEHAFDSVKANFKARADEKARDLEYYEKDGKVYQNQDGVAVEVGAGKKHTRLKGYLKIRSALNALTLAEMDPDAKETTVARLRKQLNAAYDAYVKKNGYLNDPVGSRSYIDDPSSGAVMALEKVTYTGFGAKKKIRKAEKAAIFKERSIAPIKEVTFVDNPSDALIASLRNKGCVDLPYMAKLMNSTPETVAAGLDGQIFKNPVTERYETRDEYLSGNVREKLAQAESAAAQDPSYQKNADALRKIVPKDLIPDEICVTMGAPWIPASDVQAFADHITGGAGSLSVRFIPSNAKWVVDGYGSSGRYKTKGIGLSDLLSHILNNKAIEVYSGRGEDRALDREATDAANVVAEDMKEDFRTWLWSNKTRAKRLARYYNDNYNNTVLREYDGSHLTFPGHNAKIELKPHQKNVVWRMLQGGNTLIAHCVGAGKTFEMQAAGMEMRRLGIANKPLYILPNNVVAQFTEDFYKLYPNARLLVLQSDYKTRPGYIPAVPKSTVEQKVKREDGRIETVTIPLSKLPAADRKKVTEARALRTRTLAQIKTEDWDGIIMSHSQFERLPLSPETAASFIEEQLDEVEQAIIEAKEDKVDKTTLGSIENQKKKLEEKLDEVMKTDPRDIGIPFEQLGIDQIFVDEADMFKNLHYTTSMDRVNGLPNSNANRSMDMYAKTRWLTNANGGRGVVFATGTPVSNTMAEMFTMMRYLDFQGLKEKGLNLFDNWLRTFGEIGSGIERNPSGNGFRKVNKVLRFINMPELTKMFRKFADVKTQDDLDLNIPELKGGKPTIVKIAPDPVLTNYIKNEVPKRIARMAKRRGDMKEGADNMLALTGDLRRMSITDSKIDALADEVVRKYEETTDVKGAQLIFCDQGIPKAEKDSANDGEKGEDNSAEAENAPVYNKIIKALEERGIPKDQIVFIQSAKNKAQMDDIFNKVDNGDIRILIGSTQKMGAGTNCQHHLVALHDLDAPWRPRDLEQRHGRILRQGNENKEVEIFNYVLQDSFDPIMWEKLKNKAAIVAQAMSSNMQQRTVEDADLVTLTYADAENAGTSDPLVKERISLDSEIKKYKHAQVSFNRKMIEAEWTMDAAPKKIDELKDAITKIKDDISARQDTRGDKFRMVISGKEYTERKEAQAALGNALAGLTSKVSTKIGEVSGFDIKAYAGSDELPHIQLVRKRAYMANTATVVGIENALRKAPESLLDAREMELKEKEESLKTAKEIADQKNPYAEKLAAMEKRFKEINQQIEKNMLGKADDAKEASEAPEERYSAEEQLTADSLAWKETLRKAWNSTGSSKMLPVMDTPLVLQLVGAKHLPMFLAGRKLQKIKNDHPELTKAILYKLPEYMADPMIIFKSKTVPGRVVMGLSLKDSAGVNVVVPIELNARGGRIDMNVLTSIYGRGNRRHTDNDYKWFVDNVISGNTLYVNKKRPLASTSPPGCNCPWRVEGSTTSLALV